MTPNFTEQIENLIDPVIVGALESKKLTKLPSKPIRKITHLMAKVALAVYEGGLIRSP